ncbi:MAG: zf-HC2 domain-containing protein [Acidobacteriota bacterium]
MICWRIDLWRKMIYYLNEELSSQAVARLEAHLLDCGWCRARLARLRTGQRAAKQLSRITPPQNSWAAIEAAIANDKQTDLDLAIGKPGAISAWWRRPGLITPWAVGGALVISILIGSLFLIFNKQISLKSSETTMREFGIIDLDDFQTVSIADIERNTAPHIVAEGYVSEVRIDRDGDRVFKLVEHLERPHPFIVCEIIQQIKLTPPEPGTRVRVYGVSRYDAKSDHRWYEVHPVLNIELVKN